MKKLLLLTLTLTSSIAMASELNVPNQFEDGQVTSAAQMNANFDAIQAAVNDNHARIESMQQPTKAVFQGFSTETMMGNQGLIAMQQACHNFVPGSHICNTTEFAESPYNANAVATMANSRAWILDDVFDDGDLRGVTLTSMNDTASCSGWTQADLFNSYRGRSINSSGGVELVNCVNNNKIACCK